MGPILFYDKHCLFCESLVAALAVALKSTTLRFAPIDGSTAHQFLKKHPKVNLLYYDASANKTYSKTKAIFACFMALHPWLKFMIPFSVILDPFYFIISKLSFLRSLKKKRDLHGPSFLP